MPLKQRTSFPLALGVSFGLILLAGWGLYAALFLSPASSEGVYGAFLAQTNGSESERLQQQRWYIQRNILFNQAGQRLHMKLESQEGTLVLDKSSGTDELVEEMKGVQGMVQEKLFESKGQPWQQVRTLAAAKALYYYDQEQLSADDVEVKEYVVPGQSLAVNWEDFSPTMQGKADHVEVELSNEGIEMHFTKLKAVIAP